MGSNLLVTSEEPEKFIPKLLSEDKHNIVVYQQEICSEELQIETNLINSLKDSNKSVQVESVWGSTLHHIDDMSYNPKEYLPHIYGKFREKNAGVNVRPLLPTPIKKDLPYPLKPGKVISEAESYMPTLSDFGFVEKAEHDKRECYHFIGGESKGVERMNEYMKVSVGHYAETRN